MVKQDVGIGVGWFSVIRYLSLISQEHFNKSINQ